MSWPRPVSIMTATGGTFGLSLLVWCLMMELALQLLTEYVHCCDEDAVWNITHDGDDLF